MRKLLVILTAAWFLALGSGLAERIHNAQHEAEDAAVAAANFGKNVPTPQHHDDTNCLTHAQLHAPLLSQTFITALLFLGLLLTFADVVKQSLLSRAAPSRLVCRGPPVLA